MGHQSEEERQLNALNCPIARMKSQAVLDHSRNKLAGIVIGAPQNMDEFQEQGGEAITGALPVLCV